MALAYYRKARAIREQPHASDPRDIYSERELRISYQTFGDMYAAVAQESHSPLQQQKQWLEALSWYKRALATYVELRGRGALIANDKKRLDETSDQIGTCNVALAKFRDSSPSKKTGPPRYASNMLKACSPSVALNTPYPASTGRKGAYRLRGAPNYCTQ